MELAAEGVEVDRSVRVLRTGSFDEYDSHGPAEHCLGRFWADAGADSSVAEAIAPAAPFLFGAWPVPPNTWERPLPSFFSTPLTNCKKC